ncbi:MAG TPA: PadR family transcriptional regulator [Candidatus Nanoarchaeia archaeon]|nr:PadR family transcriptional regulator [Candidatus Nanoarchaeia archaeon]
MIKRIIDGTIHFGSKVAETFMDKGDVKYLILNALNKKPMHGYQIISDIKEEFMGLYSPSPGTIYPALQMLEEQELIKTSRKEKKNYEITNKGRIYLKENQLKVTRILDSLRENKTIPKLKELAVELKELSVETIKLAAKSAKENTIKHTESMKKTKEILKNTIQEIKNAWS